MKIFKKEEISWKEELSHPWVMLSHGASDHEHTLIVLLYNEAAHKVHFSAKTSPYW